MRTFKGSISLDFKVVVKDQFIKDMREAALSEDATPFLHTVNNQHPVNDDAFIEAILRNGIRKGAQYDMEQRFLRSDMGGTISPATITLTSMAPEHDAPAVPQVVEVKRDIGPATAAALQVTPAPGIENIAFAVSV